MSSQYKYYLDGMYVTEPVNWRGFSEVIKLDKELRGQLKIVDTTMVFTGAAFAMLWDKAQNDWDSTTTVKVYESPNGNGNFKLIYSGVLLTSDLQFNHSEITASGKVRDNSYEAVLAGGKKVPVNIEASKSKNGSSITPAPRSTLIVVNPCTGNPHAFDDPIVWRMEDAMRHVISYLSDGAIDFRSPVLEDGADYDGLCITTGAFLAQTTPPAEERAPTVSLLECLTEIGRKRNTVFYIDNSGARPVFVLDYASEIRTTNKSVQIKSTRPIVTSFDVDKIYSTVKFGSPDFVPKGAEVCSDVSYFEEIDFETIKEEEYAVIGSNNIDNTLDLTTQWIVSNNLIQNSFFNGNPDNDDDIFLIDARNDAAYATNSEVIAEQSDILGDGGAIMNYRLFNSEVAQQFLGGVPRDMVLRLAPISDLFKANFTEIVTYSTQTFIEPLQFDDDYLTGNDAGNNYGNGTVQGNPVSQANSRWTSPAQGIANMRVQVRGYIYDAFTLSLPAGHEIAIKFKKYDSGNTLIGTYTKTFTNQTNGLSFDVATINTLLFEKAIFVNAGDYIQVWLGTVTTATNNITYILDNTTITDGATFFELTADSFSGGTMKVYDSADYPVYLIEGECLLNLEDWKSIDQNRFDQIEVSDDWGNRFSGWIDEVKYNRISTVIQYKLNATKSQIV